VADKRIPISHAADFARTHDLQQIVILGQRPDGTVHIVTWGKTRELCRQAAVAQDWWNGKVMPRTDKRAGSTKNLAEGT
jgi:hypothetical protein